MKQRIHLSALLLCLLLAACVLLVGCGSTVEPADTTEETYDTLPDDTEESDTITLPDNPEDYSVYAGIWLCGAQYDYDYIKLDEDGNWELYVGNDIVDSGYLKYEPEWECIYAYSDGDGSGCQFRLEGEQLYTSAYGYFTRADGMAGTHYDTNGTDTDAAVLREADAPNPELYQQDIRNLAGTWYREDEDGAIDSFFTIDEGGAWELYMATETPNEYLCTDAGSLTYSADETSMYLAKSADTDAVYRVFEFDSDMLVFGENGTYMRDAE